MPKNLPAIDAAEHRSLIQSGAFDEAKAIRNAVARRLSNLTPACVIALAKSRYPDVAPLVALFKIKNDTSAFLEQLEAAGNQTRAAVDAERAKQAAVVAAAAHRSLEVVARVDSLARIVAGIQSNNASKLERLRNAGLSGAELDAASAPVSVDDQLAERAALVAEGEALDRFIATRDERHLPEGFAAEIRVAS